jgi:hypothetical protein
MDSSEQRSVAPSASEEITSAASNSDLHHPSMFPTSRVESALNSAAFFLAPSLVEAMQRMPGTFPDSAPTPDNTEEPRFLNDDSSDQSSDKSIKDGELLEISPNDDSTSRSYPREATGRKLGRSREFCIEQDSEDERLTRVSESKNGRLMIAERELREKRHELEEAHKSYAALRKLFDEQLAGAQKELAEAQEKLKKKTIYAKSLDEYVDELETKVELLSQSHNGPPTKQAQTGTDTESAPTSDPVQQANNQQQFVPVGDAVYRWQDYVIKSFQRQRDNLVEVNQDLAERYNKAFRDAILFNRKLNDNKRAMEEHVRLCHGPHSFLPQDMSELKTDLEKIYAICIDNGEDRAEYLEAEREETRGYEEETKDESQGSTSGSDYTTGSVAEDSDAEGK